MPATITRKLAYVFVLIALAMALAFGIARAGGLFIMASESKSDVAVPDNSARPSIQTPNYDWPTDPVYYSERDDNYMLGSYGG